MLPDIKSPNIIIMNMDNLGYGDPGCYGSRMHSTPKIDRLAEEGTRFTSFYSTSGVCTPSRASLMTGCYPRRINMHCGDKAAVLMPVERKGLHPKEVTMARVLKERGYATSCVGKWHLGDQPPFLPTRHGFDEFFGCPYSEDMRPDVMGPSVPPLPLMRNETVVEASPDINYLTRRYTEEGIRFIKENISRSFFLYLAHAMPGSDKTPFASPEFRGRSANGTYGDCVEELDWSAGKIMESLKELGIDRRTIIVWTSDNGAVFHDPPQGSNAPLKGWGYNTSEGAHRIPCIVRWPGQIPPGIADDRITTMMDMLPTMARLAGTSPPIDRIIDGYDISGMLLGDKESASPYDSAGFFYYHMDQLQAVRSGPWKLYLPLEKKLNNLSGDYTTAVQAESELYNLDRDIGEKNEVADKHPDVVRRLLALAENIRRDIGDFGMEGANQRSAGYAREATPRVLG